MPTKTTALIDFDSIKQALATNIKLSEQNWDIIRKRKTPVTREEIQTLFTATVVVFKNLDSVVDYLREQNNELSRRLADLEDQRIGR